MSLQKRSFITGFLYIALAVIGPFGFMIIPNMVAESTSANVSLVGLWFIVELVIIAIEIVLTVYLWKLLNEHNKQLSFIAFIFRMMMILVMVVNSIFLLAVVLSGGSNADVFIPMHSTWIYIWQLSFSLHIVLVGYIVFRYLKTYWRYVGIALIVGAFGYFIDSLNNLVLWDIDFLTTAATILLFAVTIGEIGMAIVLLMKRIVPLNEQKAS